MTDRYLGRMARPKAHLRLLIRYGGFTCLGIGLVAGLIAWSLGAPHVTIHDQLRVNRTVGALLVFNLTANVLLVGCTLLQLRRVRRDWQAQLKDIETFEAQHREPLAIIQAIEAMDAVQAMREAANKPKLH
jgi:hypothetical protein